MVNSNVLWKIYQGVIHRFLRQRWSAYMKCGLPIEEQTPEIELIPYINLYYIRSDRFTLTSDILHIEEMYLHYIHFTDLISSVVT